MNKLLIVDDDLGCGDLYKIRFEYAKWEVKIAYSAEQALGFIKNDNYLPDAILLDIMLPGMQGDELLKILRADPKTKNVVIVILTALNLNPKDEERICADANACILKIDILPEQLVKKVEELLKKKKIENGSSNSKTNT